MEMPTIVVTTQDLERLSRLLRLQDTEETEEVADFLEGELSRARVVSPSEVPPDVVTMNSRFRYFDRFSSEPRTITLVYPEDADSQSGRISVLTPVGSALLGLKVGQTIEWPLPGGKTRTVGIAEMIYQPEASGDLDR